ncbi:MAG: hypothetical protein R3C28_23725 [Pirellulaceae bacterium]
MSHAVVDDRFQKFLIEPTSQRFSRLQTTVFKHEDYDPGSRDLDLLAALFSRREYQHVAELADELEPVWFLSPRFHFFKGLAAEELGLDAITCAARSASHACLNALLDTGDGTEAAPFKITYLADEYDIAQVLGFDSLGQQLMETDDGKRDIMLGHDDAELWFDVDRLLAAY